MQSNPHVRRNAVGAVTIDPGLLSTGESHDGRGFRVASIWRSRASVRLVLKIAQSGDGLLGTAPVEAPWIDSREGRDANPAQVRAARRPGGHGDGAGEPRGADGEGA